MALYYDSDPDASGQRIVRCSRCDYQRLTKWPIGRVHHECIGKKHYHGPGWHLARLLKLMGIRSRGACKCLEKQVFMDALGVDGCRQHFDTLLESLQEQYDAATVVQILSAAVLAVRHGLPKSLRGLLEEAIRRAAEAEQSECPLKIAGDRELTIVYCTSNREEPRFERRIIEVLVRHADGLPIISVSQQPLALGDNVCVDDLGASQENYVRQCLEGVKRAQTRFVALVEADCLYPPDYFQFRPPTEHTVYYAEEACLLWAGHREFWFKDMRELSGIAQRDHLLTVLLALDAQRPKHLFDLIPRLTKQGTFRTLAPIVSFKTGRGLHWRSPHSRRHVRDLPVWGEASRLWAEFSQEGK